MTTDADEIKPSRSQLDYLRLNHPELPPCPWSVFGNDCLLTRAHPVPHLISIEAAQVPGKRSNEARDEA